MKNKGKIWVVIVCLFVAVFTVTNYTAGTVESTNLININSCTETFMTNYFEEMSKIEDEDKENILIVTSKNKIIDTYGASKVIPAPNNQYFLVYETKEGKDLAFKNMKKLKGIVSVEENIIYKTSAYNSWGVSATGMDAASDALEARTGKKDVVVAIVDTGLNVSLFKSNYPNKLAGTYNALSDRTGESYMTDENGHGTHIAGTIAESTPSNVKIYPAKASNGSTLSSADIIRAINHIVYYNSADVINMSFGSYAPHTATHQAIQAANAEGIICVAAAGNEKMAQMAFPAGYEETIAVSAVDSTKALATFSNIGSNITFAAPGVAIKSINGFMSGTSMAAPHVAAAVAILKGYNKNITKDEAIEILKENAVDLGTKGWDHQFGYGFISFVDFDYCDCNCSNCYSINCSGCTCISCEYKDLTKDVTSIAVNKMVLETYNYGSVSNLVNTELKVYYGSNYIVKKIVDLEDVKITGYDPYKYISQTITITYAGKSTTCTLSARTTPEMFWDYTVIDGNNIKLTGMKATPVPLLYLPEKINAYVVTTIGSNLFKNANLTVVTAPSNITTIEAQAFEGSGITKFVSVASSLNLNAKAFSKTYNLESVTAPVVFNGNDTFEYCYSLKDITISGINTSVPYGTFYACTNLENVSIPNGITGVGEYAFTNTYINTLILPSSVTNIGSYAFANCFNLDSVTFPANITTLGASAFASCANMSALYIPEKLVNMSDNTFKGCTGLESISVASNNASYHSNNNANALIKKSNNTLIIGTHNTIIPEGVTAIGEYAFAYNYLLASIEIPEGVKSIGQYAFYSSENLYQVLTASTISSVAANAFGYTPTNLVFWVYSTSYFKTYAVNNGRYYRCYDPSAVTVYGIKDSYVAFESINTSDIYLKATYSDYTGTRTETIRSGIQVIYPNGSTSLRVTDTYVTLKAKNNVNKEIGGNVNVTVKKATPTYTVPTGLKANVGQKLSDITLPTGFSWVTPSTVLNAVGTKTYLAKYAPTDTTNYNTVNNISITVNVVDTKVEITPTITIASKMYDGTTTVNTNSISVAELKSSEYTVVSAVASSANVGNVTVTVKIKLTNDKYKTTEFPGKKQEYQTTVTMKIIHKKIDKPTKTNKVYVYNGKEQTLELTGFNSNIMSITGNTKTDAGERMAVIKLINSNYTWSDSTRTDVEIIWNINRADITYEAKDVHYIYDGKGYGIDIRNVNPSNSVITYADGSGNYILTSMPKYSEIGIHTIKFKISLNDNYNAVYGERKVYIYKDGIVNNTKDKFVVYDGKEHTLTMNIVVDGGYSIKYSVGNTKYDLDTLPKFKDVGEYVVNYKIEKQGRITVYGSNKVKIYGIKKLDSSIRIDGNLLKVKDFNTNYSNLINKITVYAPSFAFTTQDKNGVSKNGTAMYSGDFITLSLSSELGLNVFKYKVIILGDANLDGKISALDYVRIKNHIMKDPEIKDELSLLSADANDDGKVSALDYVRIKNHIMDGGK